MRLWKVTHSKRESKWMSETAIIKTDGDSISKALKTFRKIFPKDEIEAFILLPGRNPIILNAQSESIE